MQKLLESSMKVRFHDCDPFNHLNNSRYIDYIMTARGDQLIDAYGFDIYQLAIKEGIGWVSAQTQISYLAPALVMETIFVQTRLIQVSEKSLLLEALLWNDNKTVLKSVMWTKLVHFHLQTQRSILHSEALLKFFEKIVDPPPVKLTFEERVKQLRTKNIQTI